MVEWPDELDTAVFYEYNGFVTLEIQDNKGQSCTSNVEAWEAWKASLPPEPEPDRDSLLGLMRRCGHYLAHRAGAVSSRERVLKLLFERGEMAQADLVQLLDLRSASVSEQLGKLEAQGLVVRRRSEEDRRGVTIELTEAGRELAGSLPEGAQGAFAALDESEREQLSALLKKLLSNWEK